MRLYNQQNRFYCGVDLHARNMYTHILDAAGKTVYERGGLTSQSGLAPHRPGRKSGDTDAEARTRTIPALQQKSA